jgi:integrase
MLKNKQISQLEAPDKPYKLPDERGLVLQVNPSGRHYWRYRYKFEGVEKMLSLGVYPDVSLELARERRDEARAVLVADKIDPSRKRQEDKAERLRARAGTFKLVAEEWLDAGCPGSATKGPSKTTIDQLRRRLTNYLYHRIGHMPMVDIEIADMRAALLPITKKGRIETAHRVRALAERIWRYAIATERATRNIPADLRGTLPALRDTGGFAAITNPKPFGELLAAIDTYEGYPSTMFALKLTPLVFVRPIELRAAEWSEFDLKAGRWSIPAERMKERRAHLVPLSRQVKKLIRELQPITGNSRYLFPSVRSLRRPISDNTINAALRRMDYTSEQQTFHGFRKSASTLLHELGFEPHWIEAQLAHKIPGVAGKYNRAIYLPQRKTMMQKWADYLDELKRSEK